MVIPVNGTMRPARRLHPTPHPQIMAMANMKDSDRLELLKEIGACHIPIPGRVAVV